MWHLGNQPSGPYSNNMWSSWYCHLVLASRCYSWEHQKRFPGFRIIPLQQGYFSWRRINGAYVGGRSNPPVTAEPFRVTVNPPKTSIDSSWPSTSTSKKETHRSSPEDFRPFPKAWPRNSHNVNNKKSTTAVLTDTLLRNSLKKSTTQFLEPVKKTGQAPLPPPPHHQKKK